MNLTSSMPMISVVMSVYNGYPYLSEAVESILSQTFNDFEFIIIDDGSTDGGTDLLKAYSIKDTRIRLNIQENQGLTKSLNTGLTLARGQFIARMDADDISFNNRFKKQINALCSKPNLVLVGAEVEMISEDNIRLGARGHLQDHHAIRKRLLTGDGSAITHPVVMFNRQAAIDVGGFDEEFTTAQDLDFFLRLSEVGHVQNLPETLLAFRQHNRSINRTRSASWPKMKALAVEKTIERIGPKQFCEEFFRTERQMEFPEGYLELGKLAFRNGRRREAFRLFHLELKYGRSKKDAFKELTEIAAISLWRAIFRH